jgi:small subunit ribosomal protein S13
MSKYIQLFNLQLNLKKKLGISLNKIFGISFFRSNLICKKFGFNKNSLLEDVELNTLNDIRKYILLDYLIQNDLRKNVQTSINELISIKGVKGLRHRLRLPVRGQRTRSNHKTQKNLVRN